MDMPILFIIPGACSLGSMVALEWTNKPYKIGITTPEIRASEAFRAINPTGKVAALKDGNQVIGENLAILLSIADKYPENSMCPAINTDKRSKVYQWLSYFSASLHPAFGHALFPTRLVAAEQAENFKIGALERLKDVLNYIEKSFLASGFLLEDHATIVDAQAYALLRWGKGFKGGTPIVDISKYPKITHFLNLMEQQVAVKNALAIEEEHLNNLQNSQFAGYFTLA